MRYLKLASAKNPYTDFIELNDLQGFLCTSFQTIGISRKLEFLAIKNRQFAVENKTNFKKYSLTIEILTKYSEYDAKHRQLITFLDRNKKDGFRLYYKPYEGMDLRYCLCDIESSQRPEKMQPVLIILSQNSLWLGEEKQAITAQVVEEDSNVFAFENIDGYYSAGFYEDESIEDYFCVEFFKGFAAEASIVNKGYNEIPLNVKIYGKCVYPTVLLFKKGEDEPIKKMQVFADVDEGYYLEVNANIRENGIWLVNNNTGHKIDYSELVNNELGSPYFYIDNGEYVVEVIDKANNACTTYVSYQEEYSE